MAAGRTPNVDKIQLVPASADPSSPREGDIFYSDGTSRDEGPWIYQNGVWAQFSTGAAITVVDSLTLTPQAADPGSPTTGMLFYSDGTARATGIWVYNGTGWVQITGLRYQEFYHAAQFSVRVASTANLTLANQVEQGDTIDTKVLVAGNLVLLKNQTTASENGVYVVQVSGAPVRSTSYDTFSELNRAVVMPTEGSQAYTRYYQTAVLTSLSDNQVWSTSPTNFSFVVPPEIYELPGLIAGGGGGGATSPNVGASGTQNNGAGGSSGGTGVQPIPFRLKVTPGETITIAVAVGGSAGVAGGTTTITALSGTITSTGGATGVAAGSGFGGAGAVAVASSVIAQKVQTASGAGGNGNSGAGSSGEASIYAAAASGGLVGGGGGAGGGGGGGAGGSGLEVGGAGGRGAGISVPGQTNGVGSPGADGGKTAGGGGGGGASSVSAASGTGGRGGIGGSGYVRLAWD